MKAHCPKCRALLDRHDGVSPGANTPGPGDWTICAYCGSVLRYDEQLQLRRATGSEMLSDLTPELVLDLARSAAAGLLILENRTKRLRERAGLN